MRSELLDILICPMCKGRLELTAREKDGDEIIDGKLTCVDCREDYPIEEGIPNMLPPDLRQA